MKINNKRGAITTILDLTGTKEKPNSYFIGGVFKKQNEQTNKNH